MKIEELPKFLVNIENESYIEELKNFFKGRESDHVSYFFRKKLTDMTGKTRLPASLRSKIFWKIRGYSEDEAIQKVAQLQNTTSSKKIIDRELKKGYTKKEAQITLKEFRKKQGKIRSESYRRIEKENPEQVRKTSRFFKEYWTNKGHSEEEAVKLAWEESHKCRTRFREMLDNGEIKKGWNNTTIEYYLERGATIEEAASLLAERQATFTLEKCINRYGKEKGSKIFHTRQEKWIKKWKKLYYSGKFSTAPLTLTSTRYSKSSMLLFNELVKDFSNSKYGPNEFFIREGEKSFFYDFTLSNKIIEYHGDYWHCNPKIYKAEYFHSRKKMTAGAIWIFDSLKEQIARKKGYDFLTIWESDYKLNPEHTINKCKNFLKK